MKAVARASRRPSGGHSQAPSAPSRTRSTSQAPRAELGPLIDKLRDMDSASIAPEIADEAIVGLKFSECLPKELAAQVLQRRTCDREAVETVLEERLVVVGGRVELSPSGFAGDC